MAARSELEIHLQRSARFFVAFLRAIVFARFVTVGTNNLSTPTLPRLLHAVGVD